MTDATMTVSSDRYRKGVPPAFPESQPKYLQDELSKIERVSDLSYQDTLNVVASVTHETTERKAADSALASDITTLKAQTAKAASDISVEYTARVNGDQANADAITKLNTAVGNNNAAISNESSARASGDKANADAITNLTTTVGSNTATINQHTQSINGIAARWSVMINNNGRIAGVVLNSGQGGTSSFDIQADYLNLYKPNSNERALYWDGTQLVVRGNILATSVTADSISQTINAIPANTINRPVLNNPDVIAQGNYPINERGGYIDVYGNGDYSNFEFSEYIPTGVYVDSTWSVASTRQYLATCTIAAGTATNGGHIGYSQTEVVVGDGLGGSGPYASMDNQLYIKYTFNRDYRQDTGGFYATSLSWKLVRI